MNWIRLVRRAARLALSRPETHPNRAREEARLAAFPTWADGIADHRFRYSAFLALANAWAHRNLAAANNFSSLSRGPIHLAANGLSGRYAVELQH